mmetsp:Transcript_1894/g.5668  ORF Transcript_1894/g.5668 Transcript_1894/m.5668 type:complete len:211 (-) Transcript_1894:128-760(-)
MRIPAFVAKNVEKQRRRSMPGATCPASTSGNGLSRRQRHRRQRRETGSPQLSPLASPRVLNVVFQPASKRLFRGPRSFFRATDVAFFNKKVRLLRALGSRDTSMAQRLACWRRSQRPLHRVLLPCSSVWGSVWDVLESGAFFEGPWFGDFADRLTRIDVLQKLQNAAASKGFEKWHSGHVPRAFGSDPSASLQSALEAGCTFARAFKGAA